MSAALIRFLKKHADVITTGTAQKLAEDFGVEIDLTRL